MSSRRQRSIPLYGRYRQVSLYNNENTERGILFNQHPLRNHQAEPSVRRTKGFCLGYFWGGSGWTEYRTNVVVYFYSVISWIYFFIFMGNYSCFHIAIYLRFFTSTLLCLNAHLRLFISRQSLGIHALSCDNDIRPKCQMHRNNPQMRNLFCNSVE